MWIHCNISSAEIKKHKSSQNRVPWIPAIVAKRGHAQTPLAMLETCFLLLSGNWSWYALRFCGWYCWLYRLRQLRPLSGQFLYCHDHHTKLVKRRGNFICTTICPAPLGCCVATNNDETASGTWPRNYAATKHNRTGDGGPWFWSPKLPSYTSYKKSNVIE